MKKLLLSLALILAFTSLSFAKAKPEEKKIFLEKQTTQAISKLPEQQNSSACIAMQTRTEFEVVDGRIIWGDTTSYVQFDIACLRALVAPWFVL